MSWEKKINTEQFGNTEGSVENSTARVNAFIQEFDQTLPGKDLALQRNTLVAFQENRLLGKQGYTMRSQTLSEYVPQEVQICH